MNFAVNFHGLTRSKSIEVPNWINERLHAAKTPEEIEEIIGECEPDLAHLFDADSDFLVCDSAAELMFDVLMSKGIKCRIECGVNDYGDSHSYVVVADGKRYDPTHQGYGDFLYDLPPWEPSQDASWIGDRLYAVELRLIPGTSIQYYIAIDDYRLEENEPE